MNKVGHELPVHAQGKLVVDRLLTALNAASDRVAAKCWRFSGGAMVAVVGQALVVSVCPTRAATIPGSAINEATVRPSAALSVARGTWMVSDQSPASIDTMEPLTD